jgi:hypothetical protein
MSVLRLDGDSSGLEAAAERGRRAVQRLEAQVAESKFEFGSEGADRLAAQLDAARRSAAKLQDELDRRGVRSFSNDVRALEAAGRILGGRIGEASGALGDFNDIVDAGIGPVSALGIALGATAVGWGAVAYGAVSATSAAIDYGRANNVMTDGLRDAEAAMEGVSQAAAGLTFEIGDVLAPGVASAAYAFIGLIAAMRETVGAISDMADSRVGQLALAYLDLDVPLELAGMAFGALEERGRAATAAMEEQRIAAQDLFKVYDAESAKANGTNRASNRPAMPGAPVAQEAPYDQAAEQERIRLEIIRGLREADLKDLQAYEAEASAIQFLSLEERTAQQDEAAQRSVETAEMVARQWEQSYAIQREAAQTTASAAIDLLGLIIGESKEASIVMLAIRKAQAIADIIISTQVAAAQATAQLGIAAPPAIAAIQAAGAVQVGIVAATGVAEGIAIGQQGSQATTNNFTLVVDGLPRRNAVRQRGPAGQR